MDYDHFVKYRASLLGIVSSNELSRERKRGLILSLSLMRGVERLIEDKDYHQMVGKSQREREVLAKINLHKQALMDKVKRITDRGIDLITPFSLKYPHLQKFPRQDLPPAFLAMGNTQLLMEDRVAVVGKRVHNDWGRRFTVNVTRELIRRGSVVVSGLARGLDTIAHRTAIDSGGKTIAVLPYGISVASTKLDPYQEIIKEGRMLVLSPFKPQASFTTENAYRRNGIICGLSRELYTGHIANKGGTYHIACLAMSRGLNLFIGKNPAMDENIISHFNSYVTSWLDDGGKPIRESSVPIKQRTD